MNANGINGVLFSYKLYVYTLRCNTLVDKVDKCDTFPALLAKIKAEFNTDLFLTLLVQVPGHTVHDFSVSIM